ncbi:MAG: hypothetical protein WD895_06745 [Acidimicrobiia bacterium]
MKRAVLLLTVALVVGCTPHPPDATVLFIGNSYTFYNNLPQMVSELGASLDMRIEVESVTKGGAGLRDHLGDGVAGERIKSGDFDYVVVQEQSALPSDVNAAHELMFPAAINLASLAAASGAQLVLFETWGHRSGFAQTGHFDYWSMQRAIISTYNELSTLLGKPVAPAGEAWLLSLQTNPGIRLHDADDSHPTLEGSYLAALVITATITGRSPEEMSVDLGVPAETARQLRISATSVMAP